MSSIGHVCKLKLQRTRSVGRRSERTSKFRELYARYLRGVQTSVQPAREKLASSSHKVMWSLDQNAGSMER